MSLENTIKNMAQDYVSANNVNYLEPIGQFGSRLMGGDDAAQSRYIFTKLSPITRLIFKEEDDCLCKYLDDDGFSIEPEFYFPIFPTILGNGASGIGTGFSTDIPKFNPIDICNYIEAKIKGTEKPPLFLGIVVLQEQLNLHHLVVLSQGVNSLLSMTAQFKLQNCL